MGKNVEQKPKVEIAKEVVTPKRKYFMPEQGKVVEADSIEEAVKNSEKGDK